MKQEPKMPMKPSMPPMAMAAKEGPRGASEAAHAMIAARVKPNAPAAKMAKGGMCRGMGAAKRGGNYKG